MIYCLDASVVTKWFVKKEPGHDQSHTLLEEMITGEHIFFMQLIGILEVTRALTKKNWSVPSLFQVQNNLMKYYLEGKLNSIPIEDSLPVAMDLQVRLNLFAADALHLACAVHAGCDTFWSADRHHLKSATRDHMEERGVMVRGLGV